MTSKGYYSLIQYCPDRSRLESANVGVVLFCPEQRFLKAQMTNGNDRIRRFFGSGSFEPSAVAAAKQAIAARLATEESGFAGIEDFEQFVATRANALTLTAARPIKVHSAADTLVALFHELVGGRARSMNRPERWLEVDRVFKRPDLAGKIQFGRRIEIPVLGRVLTAPYAFQNGALNLIKPIDFSLSESAAMKSASSLALEGDLLARHTTSEPAKLIVIPRYHAAAHSGDDIPGRVNQLLTEYHVRTIAIDELPSFVDEVRRTAH